MDLVKMRHQLDRLAAEPLSAPSLPRPFPDLNTIGTVTLAEWAARYASRDPR